MQPVDELALGQPTVGDLGERMGVGGRHGLPTGRPVVRQETEGTDETHQVVLQTRSA
jgi:hypothetical protein